VLLSAISAAQGDADEFIYNSFSGADLSMDNQASVIDGLLRLSEDTDTKGHAFHTFPLAFSNNPVISSNTSSVPSFSTTFVFAIISEYDSVSSDGLAFVLSSTNQLFSSSERQYLGLPNSETMGNESNHFLAIELDTIRNLEFRDIDDNHIGVDMNSLISNASKGAGYYTPDGEFKNLKLNSGEPMQVWVDYDSERTILNVTIAPLPSTKPNRPLLSIPYDLSSVLPNTRAYVGFSSAAGPVPTMHCILGWRLGASS